MKIPQHITEKLNQRKEKNALRTLKKNTFDVDFFSNDYIGFSSSENIKAEVKSILSAYKIQHGSTGSRLLSGNYELFSQVENALKEFHQSESALLFNSGYDANIGFFSCIAQRGDVILYDSYIHASIRDGISLSLAQSYKFNHNDLLHLENLLEKFSNEKRSVFIVTESVFSMDGDSPNLLKMSELSFKYGAFLVVDEAHALGVFGHQGAGLLQELDLHQKIFARIVTFGKALGCHGACILSSVEVKEYLVNFARSFIYTTAMPPHSLATIWAGYKELSVTQNIQKLQNNILFFDNFLEKNTKKNHFIKSESAIKAIIIPNNDTVKSAASVLQKNGFGVMPILSPTVPEGQERLRICLHSFNTEKEISDLLTLLNKNINN